MSELKKHLEEEKKFLHDLSTPLSILVYQVEFVLNNPTAPDTGTRLQKSYDQIGKIIDFLEKRREQLKNS